MTKQFLRPLIVFSLLVSVVAAGSAVVKGLEDGRQSIVKVGESITIPDGVEVKGAVAVGGSVTIYGRVEEDVVALGGSVFLKDSAMVGGDAVAVGGSVVKDSGAQVKGETVEVSIGGISPVIAFFVKGGILRGWLIFSLLSLFSLLILTVLLVAVFTPQLGKVSSVIEKDLGRSFFAGFLAALLFVPIIVMLAVSIVGIVLIPVWILLVSAAGIFGYTAGAHLIGKQTLHAFKIKGKSMMVETLSGIVFLALAGMIPIGGFFIKMVVALCGVGAICLTRFGTR